MSHPPGRVAASRPLTDPDSGAAFGVALLAAHACHAQRADPAMHATLAGLFAGGRPDIVRAAQVYAAAASDTRVVVVSLALHPDASDVAALRLASVKGPVGRCA